MRLRARSRPLTLGFTSTYTGSGLTIAAFEEPGVHRKLIFTMLLLHFSVVCSSAQQPSGTPIFGSYQQNLPNLTIDLGNLNVHVNVPIYTRASRGDYPFYYNWEQDNEFWYINTTYNTWTYGAYQFEGTPIIGISYLHVAAGTCPDGTKTYQNSNFVIVDGEHTFHPVPGIKVQNDCPETGWTKTGSGYSVDGYYIYANDSVNTYVYPVITSYTPSGASISSGTSLTDRNGNVVSDTTGTSTVTYYDAQSTTTPVLTKDYSQEPSYDTYSYTGEGGNETITKHFTYYYRASAFGCGATQLVDTSQTIWVTSFSRPDGSAYTVGYEQTPGKTAAYITGRINKLILPTGGAITIAYNGSNNGMNCDGSTSGMTITSPDGTWTYTHTQPSGTYHLSTTTVTDPAGNKTAYTFTQPSGTSTPYETQRQIYTGSSTPVQTIITCYNGQAQSGCASTPNTINTISKITRYVQLPNSSGVELEVNENYDAYGRITERDNYDYGNAGTGAPGSLIRKLTYTYGSWNGSGCSTLSGNILDVYCQVQVSNGSTTLVSTTYARDSHGNPLTVTSSASGASLAHTQSYTYNPNGTVATFTDLNGDSYSYTYGYCNSSFPSVVSEPASLSKSMAWNCDGAVVTSVTDEAGTTTTINHSGEYFWRPSSIVDAMNNTTSFSYTPTTYESVLNFGSSTVDKFVTVDGLGRVHVSQTRQAPASSYFDSVETDYNSDGQVSRITQPYQGTAGATNSSAPATTYTNYDGLGRVGTITDGGGGVMSLAYSQNIFTKTVTPIPTGETAKSWAFQSDGLGRITNVCEGSGGGNWGTCSFNGWDGYWTKYTYDALGDLTGATQNAQSANPQTRSYSYDGFGRLTSETNPESGTTAKTYTYDTQKTGDLYTTLDQNGVSITYTHGALHRLLSACAGTFCRNFLYDSSNAYSGANYVNGRLAEAYTGNCGSTTCPTEYFGYDADGRTTDLWEQTPNSGGLYHVTDQYFANGMVNTLVAKNSSGNLIGGLPTITYGVDGEGRPTTVYGGSQNPVTAASYNVASQLTSLTYGSGDSDAYTYDPNTGRMTQYQFAVNGSNVTGALTWNPNGTLQQLAITDPFNSSDAQTCTYQYDPIARLMSANCGSAWSQTFTYDFADNLKKSGSLSFQPNYTDANGNTNNRYYSGLPGLNYDSNGNLLDDSFHTYTWDPFGSVTAIDSTTVTHDAFGRIVEYKGSTTRQFLYAPSGAKIARMNAQTLDTARVPLPGGEIADYHSSGFNAYGHADWLGTTRFGSTATRTKDGDWAFAPFGEVYAGGATSYTAFTGQTSDIGSNLFDFPMRESHSTQGRWISPDPAGLGAVDPMNPQTWNRYAYVGGNPLSAVDPTGLDFNDARGCTVGCGGGGVYADPFSAVTDASQRDLAIDFGGAWLDYQTQDFRTRAGLLSPVQQAFRQYLGGIPGYHTDPDTGELEQITGWQTRNLLSLATGEATPTLVPVWGDYNPTLIAGNVLPPGMNGPLQAAKQATRGFPKVSEPPSLSPGKWQPPQSLEDLINAPSKAWKYIFDNFPGLPGSGITVPIMGNPCLTSPSAMRSCVSGGGST